MKRKQYIDWLTTVFGIFGTVYGSYLISYHFNHGNGLNVLALVLLILGLISLVFAILIFVGRIIYFRKHNDNNVIEATVIEEKTEEKKIEEPVVTKIESEQKPSKISNTYAKSSSRSSYSYSSSSTVYVKLIGEGPLLRVEGSRFLDMRNNTYYRIEGNTVYEEGYGPRFEIVGNRIRDIFGGYLYEISGSNINKVVGGFYASISGNYITIHDLSSKYEITDSLTNKQILITAALLF